jgi:hypothetical protein
MHINKYRNITSLIQLHLPVTSVNFDVKTELQVQETETAVILNEVIDSIKKKDSNKKI